MNLRDKYIAWEQREYNYKYLTGMGIMVLLDFILFLITALFH